MKVIKNIFIGIFGLTILSIGGLMLWLNSNSENSVHDNPDLEILVAEYLFNDYEVHSLSKGQVWGTFPSSVWQDVNNGNEIPMEWLFDKTQFETMDSVSYGFKNTSGTKIYYMTWGTPISRIRSDYFIHKNGQTDTLLFGGFGCGTGIYLTPLKNNKTAIGSKSNPLLKNPYTNYDLEIESDSFPEFFRLLYGDSVGIRFSVATYSLPWSKYEPQKIYSKIFTVKSETLIANWRDSQMK
jgi:hypothetical protein